MTTASAAFEPAVRFLHEHLFSLDHVSEKDKKYRFEHCLRVAKIGRRVAEAEGMDPDVLALGCLLHDVGKFDAVQGVDHGRAGALLAQDFLCSIDVDPQVTHEIVQGIAMHTDDLYNRREDEQGLTHDRHGREFLRFDSEPTLLSWSIGECDNIDRFGAYRVFDTMTWFNFLDMGTAEQIAWTREMLEKLSRLRAAEYHTHTATRLWREAIDVQIGYYTRLLKEIS